MDINVNVKTLTGKVIHLEFPPNAKLGDLKQSINDGEGIPTYQITLFPLSKEQFEKFPTDDDSAIHGIIKDLRSKKIEITDAENVKSLEELGIKNNSTLLLVLALRAATAASEAPKSEGDKLRDLYSSVVLESTILSKEQIMELVQKMKKRVQEPVSGEQDFEKSSIVSNVSSILERMYTNDAVTMASTTVLEDVFDIFKNCTDTSLALDITNVFDGAARSNIDDIPKTVKLKMINMGILEALHPLFEKLSESKYVFTKDQRQIIRLLTEFQSNHDPSSTQIAALIYKRNFQQHGIFTMPETYFERHPSRYLWDEPFAFYTEMKNKAPVFNIQFLEVTGVGLAAKDSNGLSDPYFEVGLEPKYKETFKPVIKSSTINVWDMRKEKKNTISVPFDTSAVIQVFDEDLIGSDFMGALLFSPPLLHALQSKGNAASAKDVTFSGGLNAFKVSGTKYHDVTGYLIVKVSITIE